MDKKRIAIAFLIVLTNTIGATAILPMLPLYVEEQFRATPLQATLVIAAFYAAQFVAAPWLGKLSDRFGRRPILIISQIGTILSYLMIVFAVQIGIGLQGIGLTFAISGGLAAIYLARLLDGLTGGNVSVAEAYASDISDNPSRAQALGLVGGAVGLGHIVGPALAVMLSGISSIAPILGAAVISGITLLLTIIFLSETVTPERRSASKAVVSNLPTVYRESRRPVALVLSSALVMGLYIAAVVSSFSLYAERVLFPNEPTSAVIQKVGLMIIVMGLVAAVSQILLVGLLVKRLGEQKLVVLGSFLLLASAIGIGSATSITGVVVSILAYGLGYGIAWPNLQSILTHLGNRENTGNLLGLFQSAFSLALIIAPAGAGFLIQTIGSFAIYHMGTLLMVVATILSIVLFHLRLPNPYDEQIQSETSPEARGFLQRFHH